MRFLILSLFFSVPVFALTTAYVKFDHPDGWRCELSQGVWICQSSVETDRKESVILSIATMATEWDTLDNYLNYLKQERTIQDEDGTNLTAKVSYARKRNINGTEWVDSLQHNSELPGFWARYLSTVYTTGNTKLAILITYIVSEERYSQLASQFERMVASLKPNSEFNLGIPDDKGEGPLPGSEKVGPSISKGLLLERLNVKPKLPVKAPVASPPPSGVPLSPMVIGGVFAILVVLVALRIRKKRARSEAPKPPARSTPPTPATVARAGETPREPTALGDGPSKGKGKKKAS